MTINDWIQSITLFIGTIGLIFNFIQLRVANRQKRAEYVIDLYDRYYENKDTSDMYYKIEYGQFQYNPDTFPNSDDERKLDMLLELYDKFAKLYIVGNLTLQDLDYVAYNYLIIYQDENVKTYLAYLDNWFKERHFRIKPFHAFRRVGELLEKTYFDSNHQKRG